MPYAPYSTYTWTQNFCLKLAKIQDNSMGQPLSNASSWARSNVPAKGISNLHNRHCPPAGYWYCRVYRQPCFYLVISFVGCVFCFERLFIYCPWRLRSLQSMFHLQISKQMNSRLLQAHDVDNKETRCIWSSSYIYGLGQAGRTGSTGLHL